MADASVGNVSVGYNSEQECHTYSRNFVSIIDVVKFISLAVSTKEFERDYRAREKEYGKAYFDRIGGDVNRQIRSSQTCNFLARAVQISSAAAALHDFLHHSSADVPQWFDWGMTGRPRLDNSVRVLAMNALTHLSQYENKVVGAWMSGNLNLRECSDGLHDVQQRFNELDLERVGFEQEELVEFLAENKIFPAIEDLEGECLVTNPKLFQHVEIAEDRSEGNESGSQENSENCHELLEDLDSGQSQAQRMMDAALKELPRNLTTVDLAAVFSDTRKCECQTGRDFDEWKSYLQDSRRPPALE